MIVLIDILICVGKGQKLLIITVYQATPQVCVQNGKPVPTQIGYGLILGLYCYAYVFLVKSEQLISNNKISRFLMYNLRISHNKGSFVQKIQQKRKKGDSSEFLLCFPGILCCAYILAPTGPTGPAGRYSPGMDGPTGPTGPDVTATYTFASNYMGGTVLPDPLGDALLGVTVPLPNVGQSSTNIDVDKASSEFISKIDGYFQISYNLNPPTPVVGTAQIVINNEVIKSPSRLRSWLQTTSPARSWYRYARETGSPFGQSAPHRSCCRLSLPGLPCSCSA